MAKQSFVERTLGRRQLVRRERKHGPFSRARCHAKAQASRLPAPTGRCRRSSVAQLLIPVGRTALGRQVKQIPQRLDGADVTRILIAIRWGIEEL